MQKNKVKYNICNVHYAVLTLGQDGTVSYGSPVPMPGAVSLSLEPNGEPSNFYADGYAYYTISNNMGYEGDLELAMVPESFRTEVLKDSLDANNVLLENANTETANFALLFEFDGDVRKIRHVMYKCSASRPTIESQTKEDEIEVKTEKFSIKAAPLASGYVKAKTGDITTDAVYQNWYQSVYLPAGAAAEVTLSNLAIGSLSLTPSFQSEVIAYTATTGNESDIIAAQSTAPEATVTITVNGEEIISGNVAQWQSGTNTVVVTVRNGAASKQYAVSVTKEG